MNKLMWEMWVCSVNNIVIISANKCLVTGLPKAPGDVCNFRH